MTTKTLSIILSLSILIFIIELTRRDKLTFKYAFLWILISSAALFFAIFDKLLFSVSAFLGFELPSNFIFFAVSCGFVFLSLFLTVFLCQQNNRNDKMAQKIGILEEEINRLKNK